MSMENVKKFLELVKTDEGLARKVVELKDSLQNSSNAGDEKEILAEKVLPLAKAHGLEFTVEDFLEYSNSMSGELSDDDLLNVSGGLSAKGVALGLLFATGLSFVPTVLSSFAADDSLAPGTSISQSDGAGQEDSSPMELEEDIPMELKERKVENKVRSSREAVRRAGKKVRSAQKRVDTLESKLKKEAKVNDLSKLNRKQKKTFSKLINQIAMAKEDLSAAEQNLAAAKDLSVIAEAKSSLRTERNLNLKKEKATGQEKLETLNNAIDDAYGKGDDSLTAATGLKTELKTALDGYSAEAITQAASNVDDVVNKLKESVEKEKNAAQEKLRNATEQGRKALNELDTAISNAGDKGGDSLTAATDLKTELDTALKGGNAETITNAVNRVDDVVTKLNNAVEKEQNDKQERLTKADAERQLKEAMENGQKKLETLNNAIDDAYGKGGDSLTVAEKLKTELETALSKDSAEAITQAASRVDGVVTELNNAVENQEKAKNTEKTVNEINSMRKNYKSYISQDQQALDSWTKNEQILNNYKGKFDSNDAESEVTKIMAETQLEILSNMLKKANQLNINDGFTSGFREDEISLKNAIEENNMSKLKSLINTISDDLNSFFEHINNKEQNNRMKDVETIIQQGKINLTEENNLKNNKPEKNTAENLKKAESSIIEKINLTFKIYNKFLCQKYGTNTIEEAITNNPDDLGELNMLIKLKGFIENNSGQFSFDTLNKFWNFVELSIYDIHLEHKDDAKQAFIEDVNSYKTELTNRENNNDFTDDVKKLNEIINNIKSLNDIDTNDNEAETFANLQDQFNAIRKNPSTVNLGDPKLEEKQVELKTEVNRPTEVTENEKEEEERKQKEEQEREQKEKCLAMLNDINDEITALARDYYRGNTEALEERSNSIEKKLKNPNTELKQIKSEIESLTSLVKENETLLGINDRIKKLNGQKKDTLALERKYGRANDMLRDFLDNKNGVTAEAVQKAINELNTAISNVDNLKRVKFAGRGWNHDGTVKNVYNCLKEADFDIDRIENQDEWQDSFKYVLGTMRSSPDGQTLEAKANFTECGTGADDTEHKAMLKALALFAKEDYKQNGTAKEVDPTTKDISKVTIDDELKKFVENKK